MLDFSNFQFVEELIKNETPLKTKLGNKAFLVKNLIKYSENLSYLNKTDSKDAKYNFDMPYLGFVLDQTNNSIRSAFFNLEGKIQSNGILTIQDDLVDFWED